MVFALAFVAMIVMCVIVAASKFTSNHSTIALKRSLQIYDRTLLSEMDCFVMPAIGKKALETEISKIPFVSKISGAGKSVWMQGLFILVGGWVFLPGFFFLSFWNQLNRKHLRCTKNLRNFTSNQENLDRTFLF